MKPVVIVGAGVSGLAAGVALSLRGIPVTILERKPHGGGRAYSFIDRGSGEETDNGQHVLIAGYVRTLRFLETIGARHLLRTQPRPTLTFHHPDKGFATFSLPRVFSPLHLVAGILGSRLFGWIDKLRLFRAGMALTSDIPPDADCSIDEWLARHGQSDELRRSFWDPLAIAIMNEHTAKASARIFVHALRVAFLAKWNGAALVLPSVGLSTLFAAPANDFIRAHGGEIRFSSEAEEIIVSGGRARAVVMTDGSKLECSGVVVTVPPSELANIQLRDESGGKSSTIAMHGIEDFATHTTPIVSIHLWFDRELMEEEMVGVIGRTIQWVFNKRKLGSEKRGGGHISVVISAAGGIVDRSNEELTSIALGDLRALYGDSVTPPLRALVIREKRATISITPGIEEKRPGHATAWENIFLGGDWTATGLPATIEGAVISGEIAAGALADLVGGDMVST